MEFPPELYYTKEHEWSRLEGDTVTIGITDYAQSELGDVVFVELPETGAKFNHGDVFGTIEAVKAVSDMYSPVSGEVIEINTALEETPELVNQSPYEEGWMIKMKLSDKAVIDSLLSAEAYQKMIEGE
ncbi:glycine cleavage system protein GcvH [bacterium]|nr:glycine cleavage system protein GcvH [bacterium]